MMFNQRYGFVHADSNPVPEQAFAHELGHGGFGLTHTENDGKNVMYNYGGDKGSWRLRHAQWDLIHGAAASKSDASAKQAAAPTVQFDEQLQFLTPEGQPYARMDFRLTLEGGSILRGRTDDQGKTPRIATPQPAKIERLDFYTSELSRCPTHALHNEDDSTVVLTYQLRGIGTNSNRVGVSIVKVTPEGESRPLTAGEIAMCRPIFKNAIDYGKVRVHNHEYLLFGLQPTNTAMTPNGELYFNPEWFEADFSAPRNISRSSAGANGLKAWFIHEMVHVWQYQLGYGVKWHGVQRWKLDYHYTLDRTKKLSDYNMEAQGDILRDYFALDI